MLQIIMELWYLLNYKALLNYKIIQNVHPDTNSKTVILKSAKASPNLIENKTNKILKNNK